MDGAAEPIGRSLSVAAWRMPGRSYPPGSASGAGGCWRGVNVERICCPFRSGEPVHRARWSRISVHIRREALAGPLGQAHGPTFADAGGRSPLRAGIDDGADSQYRYETPLDRTGYHSNLSRATERSACSASRSAASTGLSRTIPHGRVTSGGDRELNSLQPFQRPRASGPAGKAARRRSRSSSPACRSSHWSSRLRDRAQTSRTSSRHLDSGRRNCGRRAAGPGRLPVAETALLLSTAPPRSPCIRRRIRDVSPRPDRTTGDPGPRRTCGRKLEIFVVQAGACSSGPALRLDPIHRAPL